MRFIPWITYDPNASAWINAVQAQDGQDLEQAVKWEMNKLVLNLKSNSIWDDIITMTVRMAARSLAGALVDVKNPASSWANSGFVAGDYNRTTGLIGDGSSKYLDSGIANNSLGQDNRAIWEYVTAVSTGSNDHYFGSENQSSSGATAIRRESSSNTKANASGSAGDVHSGANAIGLIGVSRSTSTGFTSRGGQADRSITRDSTTPNSNTVFFYAFNNGSGAGNVSNHRGCAGAIGPAHSLSVAESIIADFVAAITALSL